MWATPHAQLLTMWGRRRVGKSALLSRFAGGKRAVYVYGTRIAESDILAGLALQAAELGRDTYLRSAPFPTWDHAFDYLENLARTERLVVIFDGFPYLCDVTRGLDTLVQRWWDRVQHTSGLVLVLAGSAFSFMQGLTGARGALHGRRTAQMEVEPFDYFDAAHFFPDLSPVDRVRTYAFFGGVPAYLRHLDTGSSLAENVRSTLFAPGHVLFREAEELLRTEFHQEALYASILRAVAGGEQSPSDIARAVGRHSADEVFEHLRRLQNLHLLKREVPITEWDRLRGRRALYRLADPYLRAWFRFVLPYQSFLQLGRALDVWEKDVAPALDEFVAATTWEEVCMQHLWRQLAAGALPARFSHLGRWWDGADEIDLVGLWDGKVTLVGECKWTAAPVDERTLFALQRKTHKLPMDEPPLWVLTSRSGFDPGLRRRAGREALLLIEPVDMF
jgi:AAA+ ATPase superfamily predicted ATPase